MDLDTKGLALDDTVQAKISGRRLKVNIGGFALFNDRPSVQVLVEWMAKDNQPKSTWTSIDNIKEFPQEEHPLDVGQRHE